mmetsp:Transcript_29695/g.27159  ORF Transcript_29695/g.27159 Transcript_29695/m.27159 type:complete len:337 (+) Transcript_29695:175-1185(+)
MSCRNLKNMDILSLTDPQVRAYMQQKNQFIHIGNTEIVQDNLNPDFTKTLTLDYIFEIKQIIKFEVFNTDGKTKHELCGTVIVPLGEIVGAKNMSLVCKIKNQGSVNGELILKAEKAPQNLSVAHFTFSATGLSNTRSFLKKIVGIKSNPFLKLSRPSGDSGKVVVHQTENQSGTLNPIWEHFEIKVSKLCNADYYRPIRAEVYSKDQFEEKLMGGCEFTMDEIISQEKRKFRLTKKNNQAGALELRKFMIEEKASFLDYLKGGTQLAVMLAIDFTGSNGDPNSLDSLHSIKYDGTLNEYQQAIRGVCDILLNYDYDKKVPMFGFGGKPKFPQFSQ